MTLEEMIKKVETEFPEWEWALRKDHKRGYLANIYTEEFRLYSPCYASTPVAAMMASLEVVKRLEPSIERTPQ